MLIIITSTGNWITFFLSKIVYVSIKEERYVMKSSNLSTWYCSLWSWRRVNKRFNSALEKYPREFFIHLMKTSHSPMPKGAYCSHYKKIKHTVLGNFLPRLFRNSSQKCSSDWLSLFLSNAIHFIKYYLIDNRNRVSTYCRPRTIVKCKYIIRNHTNMF